VNRGVRRLILAALSIAGAAVAVRAAEPGPPPESLARAARLERLTDAARQPVGIVRAPGDPAGRMFVVERGGTIRILRDRTLEATPFLDVSSRITTRHTEQGLLGFAFHPRFAENRRFFVNYTDTKGDTRVVEMRADANDRDRAEGGFERELLFIDQPYANHNGGNLLFGPDGKLYVGTGDGGAAGDPHGNAQSRDSLLGKMLRLDVDAEKPVPHVAAVGLRNPWRYTFDRKTGDLYVADVGQEKYEWVTVVPAGRLEGRNFGWNVVEGAHCFARPTCDTSRFTLPTVEYTHDLGCSIIGGNVYRGKALPELDGVYFYADFCTALLRSFRFRDGRAEDAWDWKAALDPDGQLAKVAAFGEDADGELYVVSHDGLIWKLVRR
jgi:glucose/arabinose dehydrogenase